MNFDEEITDDVNNMNRGGCRSLIFTEARIITFMEIIKMAEIGKKPLLNPRFFQKLKS